MILADTAEQRAGAAGVTMTEAAAVFSTAEPSFWRP
jgi:hypothetical protein